MGTNNATSALAEELNGAWRHAGGVNTPTTARGGYVTSPTSHQDDYTSALLLQIQHLGINNGSADGHMNPMATAAAVAAVTGPHQGSGVIRPNMSMQVAAQNAHQASEEGVSALSLLLMQQQAAQQAQQQVYTNQSSPMESTLPAITTTTANISSLPVSRLLPETLAELELAAVLDSPHHHRQQQHQANWTVPFTHPALAKIKAGNPCMNSSNNHSGGFGGGGGGGRNSGLGGSQNATPMAAHAQNTTTTDSPTIRAAWGDSAALDMYTTTAAVSSRSSSLGVSPRDSISVLPLRSSSSGSQQRYECSLPQEQPGFEALKSIWSTQ